jgi:hypothetical protein
MSRVGDTSSAGLELGLELREQDGELLVIALSSRESCCFGDGCGGNELKRA